MRLRHLLLLAILLIAVATRALAEERIRVEASFHKTPLGLGPFD
jgi:hypothetical protein